MNNLIGEPQCAPRVHQRQSPPQIWNFIPTVEFHSSSKRLYSESQLFPALCPTFAAVHAIRIPRTNPPAARPPVENSIFANYSATFSHCFGRTTLCVAEHNELFRPVFLFPLAHVLLLPPFLPGFPGPGRCIHRFIYSARHGQLIFQSEFSRASRARQGENDDANRDEFAHTDTKGLLPNNGYTQSVFTPAEFELRAFSSKK